MVAVMSCVRSLGLPPLWYRVRWKRVASLTFFCKALCVVERFWYRYSFILARGDAAFHGVTQQLVLRLFGEGTFPNGTELRPSNRSQIDGFPGLLGFPFQKRSGRSSYLFYCFFFVLSLYCLIRVPGLGTLSARFGHSDCPER